MQSVTSKTLVIGFIPLIDCASLVIAVEKEFAAAEGLSIALVRESSWASIRDRLVVRQFDAAHMLGPMSIASTLGIGHLKVPVIAPYSMNLGGNAITVTNDLWLQMKQHGALPGGEPAQQCVALAHVVRERVANNLEPLTFGMVYPFSCHNYELRYWLAAGGIDPDRDVRLVVIPPPLAVDALRQGQVDGYCVGEPWNSLAVAAGVGCIATTTSAIWRLGPEKVLGCRADWAERNSDRLAALIRAMYQASCWCDQAENHAELAAILSKPRYVGVSAKILQLSLSGQLIFEPDSLPIDTKDFIVFARHNATFPWISHAAWFYSQMIRWGQLSVAASNPNDDRLKLACDTYRPDIYRQALRALHVSLPPHDSKIEGIQEMPSSSTAAAGFFDKREFNPAALQAYMAAPEFPFAG